LGCWLINIYYLLLDIREALEVPWSALYVLEFCPELIQLFVAEDLYPQLLLVNINTAFF